MRKYIFALFSILVVLLGSYLSFGFYRNSLLSTNIDYGSYSECFNDSTIVNRDFGLWNKEGVFEVRFVASGNSHCFAPKFPSIEVTSTNVTHWLHIVTTTGDVQFSGKHSSFGNKEQYWTFVDVGSQGKRDKSNPFYSVGSVFRDNPGWTVAPHIHLKWTGKLFALTEKDGVFYPVGALAWGFNLKSWALFPEAIDPTSLDTDAWLAVVSLLNEEYPNYEFSTELRPRT
ncbi:hypothetical protein KW488_22185 [Vibrio fluvialis]|nr:hypothetical protein [Vibrio fluvialis]